MDQLPLPGFEFHEDRRGYVYIGIRSQQIKIGYSLQDPLGRCKQLGLKPLLIVHGTLNDEKALHQKFRRSWIDREWFMFTPELAGFVAQHANTTVDVLRTLAA